MAKPDTSTSLAGTDEGDCKFRCRTNRQAFLAGWEAAIEFVEGWFDAPVKLSETDARRQAWLEWRRGE